MTRSPSGGCCRDRRYRAFSFRPRLEEIERRMLLTVNVTAIPIVSVESAGFNGLVATFVSTSPPSTAPPVITDFTASITWGDGHVSSGTISVDPNLKGQFDVSGSNTYAEEGSYGFSVTVNDLTDSTSATAGNTATVGDAALTGAIGINVGATEGTQFTAQVASFTDTNPLGTVSDFSATINWGDGTPIDTNAVFTQPGGVGTPFIVSGTHDYAEKGTHNVVVSIFDVGLSSATVVSTAQVADAGLTGTGTTLSAIEGNPLFNATVATFTDANPAAPLTDFSATINWGDGTPLDPNTTITQPGGVGTPFIVSGTHDYAEQGNHNVVVAITDVDGSNATVVSTARIADAPLTARGTTLSATEGNPLVNASVATFTDANPAAPLTDFSATINWGDGTPLDTNTVITRQIVGDGFFFLVSGTHTYAEEGSLTVSVAISDVGGSTAQASSTARIADAGLKASGINVSAVEGNAVIAPVASFTDGNPIAPLSDFTATINWGDGTPLDTNAIITQPGGVGTGFIVSGTHIYAEEGNDNVTVAILDVGGSNATIVSSARVADASLTARGTTVNATEGVPLVNATVATFTDANPTAPLSDFSATIFWGDSAIGSTGTIVQPGGPGAALNVTGSHTYDNAGTYSIAVLITDIGGSSAQAASTANVAFSFVVTNTNDSGRGSLRRAIQNSNIHPGEDTITFAIPGAGPQVIRLLSPLPAITDGVIIDAYTQPGARPNTLASGDNANILVAVDGSATGPAADGLLISAGPSVVRGLAIEHFGGAGIFDEAPSLIEGNFIGTDVTGTQALGNSLDGVVIAAPPISLGLSGGPRISAVLPSTIGGTTPDARNIISGNGGSGIEIFGATVRSNLVEGNLIGTDATGTRALGNQFVGVFLNGSPFNTVGGTAAGAGNVISGNSLPGVEIFGAGATGNRVLGNLVGTDVSGTRAVGNGNIGVLINQASGNTIGGTTAAERNIISGNVAVGPVTPPTVPPEQTGGGGVVIIGPAATGNLVEGNFIGTDRTGTNAVGNAFDGVALSAAGRNTIGGTAFGAGNVISANGFVGIRIVGAASTGNLIAGNLIGTNAAGTSGLGNAFDGIFLNNAGANTIGGTMPGARNVISGNGGSGIQAFGPGSAFNVVAGNLIGSNASATAGLGNGFDGVFLDGAPGNLIGGTAAGSANLIESNGFSGVEIFGRTGTRNAVQGNVILNNRAFGVLVQNAPRNTIGGRAAGAGNLVANNAFGGIEIVVNGSPGGPGAAGNVVQGNLLANNGRGPFQLGGSAPLRASSLPRPLGRLSLRGSRRGVTK